MNGSKESPNYYCGGGRGSSHVIDALVFDSEMEATARYTKDLGKALPENELVKLSPKMEAQLAFEQAIKEAYEWSARMTDKRRKFVPKVDMAIQLSHPYYRLLFEKQWKEGQLRTTYKDSLSEFVVVCVADWIFNRKASVRINLSIDNGNVPKQSKK